MPFVTPFLRARCPALAGLVLALASSAAQALIVPSTHELTAATSISAPDQLRGLANADVLFNGEARSSGLGPQGQVSTASARQTFTRHTREFGFDAVAEVALALSAGVSGEASSRFIRNVFLDSEADFSFHGMLDASGNASVQAFLVVREFAADNGSLLDPLVVDLSTEHEQTLAGRLEPGHYLFGFALTASSNDPGESAAGRLTVDLLIDPVGDDVNQQVPEPQSLGLALAALVPLLARRRRRLATA